MFREPHLLNELQSRHGEDRSGALCWPERALSSSDTPDLALSSSVVVLGQVGMPTSIQAHCTTPRGTISIGTRRTRGQHHTAFEVWQVSSWAGSRGCLKGLEKRRRNPTQGNRSQMILLLRTQPDQTCWSASFLFL